LAGVLAKVNGSDMEDLLKLAEVNGLLISGLANVKNLQISD
jgi:hypothetical protein